MILETKFRINPGLGVRFGYIRIMILSLVLDIGKSLVNL